MNSSDLYLRFLVNLGVDKRLRGKIPNHEIKDIYIPRAKMELDVFQQVGISDYFLVLRGVYDWCVANDIPTGIGRGSAAGSLVSYLIGITQVNPIPFNLLFERFYNAGRMETRQLPDIDFDVSQEHRDRVIKEYLIPTYGEDFIAPIGTFGRIHSKSAVKALGRVLRVPLDDTDKISKAIPQKRGITGDLDDVFDEQDFRGNPTKDAEYLRGAAAKYPELFEMVPIIDEMDAIQTESVHAAGIIVSPIPVGDYVPLRWTPSKQLACTSFDMYELENTGAMKLDLLGIRNLDIVQNTIKRAGLPVTYHQFIENIEFDDQKTWDLLRSGKSVGVFQFESRFMSRILKDVEPNCIEDLSAINALGRPGPLDARLEVHEEDIIGGIENCPFLKKRLKEQDGKKTLNMIEVYVARKKGELKTIYLHPLLEPILKNTYGVPVMQEQIMQMAQALAGYSLESADVLRGILGKKKVDKMPKERIKFMDGCAANNIAENVAQQIWSQMETFAEYGFNKCVPAGSKVQTKRGLVNIEDVVAGDEVISLTNAADKDSKVLWRKVIGVHSKGKQRCVELSCSSRLTHRCTLNHRVLTPKGIVEASKLKVNDFLVAPIYTPCATTEETIGEDMARFVALVATAPHYTQSPGEVVLWYNTRDEGDYLVGVLERIGARNIDIEEKTYASGRVLAHFDYPPIFDDIVGVTYRDRKLHIDGFNLLETKAFLEAFLLVHTSVDLGEKKLYASLGNMEMGYAIRRALQRIGVYSSVNPFMGKSGYATQHTYSKVFFSGKKSIEMALRMLPKAFSPQTTEKIHKIIANKMNMNRIATYLERTRIHNIKMCGEMETYDLELEAESDEERLFLCDGVFTHNSHSVSYAILAYITAYLKANYPAEFMASLISSDKDIEKRSVWVNDARETMKLRVSVPDVNESDEDFIASKGSLLFGLKEIKGMGLVAVRSLLEERAKNGPFKSLRDFYERVDLSCVNSARVKALAYAGAFTSLHPNRTEVIEWDEKIREARASVSGKIKLRRANVEQQSLFLVMGDDELWESKANTVQKRQLAEGKKTKEQLLEAIRTKLEKDLAKNKEELAEFEAGDYIGDLPKMPDMNLSDILEKEKELLGIQVSGTIASPFANEIMMYSECSVADLFDADFVAMGFGERFCGVLNDINVTEVKNGINKGKKMAICNFTDLTGKIKLLLFSKVYEKSAKLLAEGKPFVVEGKLSEEGDALICFGIKPC